jgi:hypothetical protein
MPTDASDGSTSACRRELKRSLGFLSFLVVSFLEEWLLFRVYKNLPFRLLRNNPSQQVS